jgi:YihY family inner membrane protein
MREHLRPAWVFWNKLDHDWVLNLSGMLAFNFLMATFPLLLLLLALAQLVIGAINPAAEQQLIQNIANAFPSVGHDLIAAATTNLRHNAGLFFILGLIASLFLGSRVFITIEDCFGIIFRVPGRDLIPQNVMAVGMLLLFVLLVPLFFLLSIIPETLLAHPAPDMAGFTAVVLQVVTLLGAVVVGMAFFGAIYIVVPNRPVAWREVWPGTLLAAVLLVLYEKLFPWYTSIFLRPENFGSIAGFAIVIVIFYYYLAFILLLAAEFNSWRAGYRTTTGDLQTLIHRAQGVIERRNTTK